MPPGAAAPQDPGRVRFLRACDRCRSRKIKCGNENPCSKCVAAKATCSFSSSGSQGRSLLSSAEQIGAATDVESSPTEAGPSVNKRRLSSSSGDDPSGKKRSSTRGNSTHFFLSSHGIPHHAGSSSGLPLLEATRRLASDTAGEQKQAGMPDLDWQWLQDLLSDGDTASVRNSDGNGQPEADEYFPGRDIAHSSAGDELLSSIQDIIPADLLNDLLGIFFSTIHPVWPIMHIPTFFEDLQQLREHSFSALVVSMCMLASRYSSDPRVFTDPENPATAGVRYYELFNRLIEHAVNSDHVIYAIKGRFFASMFHCVDNVPHPVAQGLFADALSRTLDGGLHRHVSAEIWGNPVVREVRSRVAWAIYTWDKQIAAFCGRPFLNGLWDMDVRLPEPFHYEHWHSPEWPIEKDKEYVANFRQLIQLSGVLEFALRASVDRPIVENSSFLTDLARQSRPALDDTSRLDITMAALRKWRSSAPPAVSLPLAKDRSHLPEYSVASEQVASIYQMW
ncbi:hypothetical protein Q8F55_001017 [Vanrija albida]|uniref:Zn(2)-C6 fungal-type domain-containing protein n=1 Tax=Vanrija albida TaxID=181172 RepID=A0ABR3QF27_9TREE